MKIKALVWLEDVVDKLLWKHDVEEHEVREALESLPLFRFVEKGHRNDEDVYAAFGRTKAGRYTIVFFVYNKDNRAMILSARDMTLSERRLYERM